MVKKNCKKDKKTKKYQNIKFIFLKKMTNIKTKLIQNIKSNLNRISTILT